MQSRGSRENTSLYCNNPHSTHNQFPPALAGGYASHKNEWASAETFLSIEILNLLQFFWLKPVGVFIVIHANGLKPNPIQWLR
jgi:hypothetical protein